MSRIWCWFPGICKRLWKIHIAFICIANTFAKTLLDYICREAYISLFHTDVQYSFNMVKNSLSFIQKFNRSHWATGESILPAELNSFFYISIVWQQPSLNQLENCEVWLLTFRAIFVTYFLAFLIWKPCFNCFPVQI